MLYTFDTARQVLVMSDLRRNLILKRANSYLIKLKDVATTVDFADTFAEKLADYIRYSPDFHYVDLKDEVIEITEKM